jgi:hypothetical protein
LPDLRQAVPGKPAGRHRRSSPRSAWWKWALMATVWVTMGAILTLAALYHEPETETPAWAEQPPGVGAGAAAGTGQYGAPHTTARNGAAPARELAQDAVAPEGARQQPSQASNTPSPTPQPGRSPRPQPAPAPPPPPQSSTSSSSTPAPPGSSAPPSEPASGLPSGPQSSSSSAPSSPDPSGSPSTQG